MALFQRRQQEVATLSEVDSQRRQRSMSMLKGVQEDEALSPDDKMLFAETLREVSKSCDNHVRVMCTSCVMMYVMKMHLLPYLFIT